jgi:hypothetical protein
MLACSFYQQVKPCDKPAIRKIDKDQRSSLDWRRYLFRNSKFQHYLHIQEGSLWKNYKLVYQVKILQPLIIKWCKGNRYHCISVHRKYSYHQNRAYFITAKRLFIHLCTTYRNNSQKNLTRRCKPSSCKHFISKRYLVITGLAVRIHLPKIASLKFNHILSPNYKWSHIVDRLS